MTVDKVFCTMPWMEVHINADGSYMTCGDQPNRSTGTDFAAKHNILRMSVQEWVNSQHQKSARYDKAAGIPNSLCNQCYQEDAVGSESKRIRENSKSGISPVNFYKTFAASKDQAHFDYSLQNAGETTYKPISYHISLGNECNLSCKMCVPWASSKVAAQWKQQGQWVGPIRLNWTDDNTRWQELLDTMCNTEDLQFVHVIGGEPMLNPKFEQLADSLIAAGRTNIYFGFTTNGTILNIPLVEKLKAFRHVEIGISIECVGELNDYVRQGCNTDQVLANIEEYAKHRSESHVYVTIRPVPSALSVHRLDDLYRWCIDRKLDVLTNFLANPPFLQIRNLPHDVKTRLLVQYRHWVPAEPSSDSKNANPRDPTWFREHIDNEIKAIITALELPEDPQLTKQLYEKLSLWHWLDHEEIAKYFESIDYT